MPVTLHQRSPLATQLGATISAGPIAADAVDVDSWMQTSVPGLGAAGDTSTAMPSVAAGSPPDQPPRPPSCAACWFPDSRPPVLVSTGDKGEDGHMAPIEMSRLARLCWAIDVWRWVLAVMNIVAAGCFVVGCVGFYACGVVRTVGDAVPRRQPPVLAGCVGGRAPEHGPST